MSRLGDQPADIGCLSKYHLFAVPLHGLLTQVSIRSAQSQSGSVVAPTCRAPCDTGTHSWLEAAATRLVVDAAVQAVYHIDVYHDDQVLSRHCYRPAPIAGHKVTLMYFDLSTTTLITPTYADTAQRLTPLVTVTAAGIE